MNFKDATDKLFQGLSHRQLADSLGVSVATIRQARLDRSANAYRTPPIKWRRAVIRLAEEQVGHYRQLIEALRNDQDEEKIK